jgi:hypothetical protein
MTRIFTDGAEMRDLLAFNSVTYPPQTTIESAFPAISPYYYRTSYILGQSMTVNIATNTEIYTRQRINFYGGITTDYYAVYIYSDGTVIASVRLKGGSLAWTGWSAGTELVTSTVIPVVNTWYLTELYFKLADAPNGRMVFYVDGNKILDFTGDTKIAAPVTFNKIIWGILAAGEVRHDDLAINDTAGAVDNSWCGDSVVVKITPSGSGTVNSFHNSGSTSGSSNYTYVDEYPSDSDTSYVYVSASSTGDKDQYRLSTFNGAGKTITRIYPEIRVKKTIGDSSTIDLGFLPNGGTDQLSGSQVIGVTYGRLVGTSASTNPVTGLAWTASDLNLLEYIIKK